MRIRVVIPRVPRNVFRTAVSQRTVRTEGAALCNYNRADLGDLRSPRAEVVPCALFLLK